MANKVKIANNIFRMLSWFFFFQGTECTLLALFRRMELAAFTKDLLQIKIKCKAGKAASSRTAPIRSLMAEEIK